MTNDVFIRIIVLIIALVNQTLTATGKNPLPFSDDTVYEAATLIVTIVASLWAGWKNNSITKSAQLCDKVMRCLKSGQISKEAVEELLKCK